MITTTSTRSVPTSKNKSVWYEGPVVNVVLLSFIGSFFSKIGLCSQGRPQSLSVQMSVPHRMLVTLVPVLSWVLQIIADLQLYLNLGTK